MAIHLQTAIEQQEALGTESKFSEGGNSNANKSVLSIVITSRNLQNDILKEKVAQTYYLFLLFVF